MPADAERKRRAARIVRRLAAAYPDAKCSLDFSTPLELLVATILSAQCTDARVNQLTPGLFRKYPTAAHYAHASQSELERDVQPTGFFRNKAKSIRLCCQALLEKHDGKVPDALDALVELPGVGRKTANVILGTAFNRAEGVVVDTHVGRIVRRLGLSAEKDPENVVRDLMDLFARKEWIALGHRLIRHGRQCCTARKPNCPDCPLEDLCPKIGVQTS